MLNAKLERHLARPHALPREISTYIYIYIYIYMRLNSIRTWCKSLCLRYPIILCHVRFFKIIAHKILSHNAHNYYLFQYIKTLN